METGIIHVVQQFAMIAGSSVGVWGITEIVKRTPSITSISPGQVVRIRAFAAVLSAIAAIFTGWTNGNLDPNSVQAAVMQILDFALIMLGAHTIHKSVKTVEEE